MILPFFKWGMMMDLPKRKPNRLKVYDYSTRGAYFITICVKEKKCILRGSGGNRLRFAGFRAGFTHSNIIDTKIQTCRNARNLLENFVIFSEILLDK